MGKFIYMYKGPATPTDQYTEEQSAALMAAWGAWMEKVGPALVDGGAPFVAGTAVSDDGTEAAAADLQGYSIIEADSLEAAKAHTAGHPFLADASGGQYSIHIFELGAM